MRSILRAFRDSALEWGGALNGMRDTLYYSGVTANAMLLAAHQGPAAGLKCFVRYAFFREASRVICHMVPALRKSPCTIKGAFEHLSNREELAVAGTMFNLAAVALVGCNIDHGTPPLFASVNALLGIYQTIKGPGTVAGHIKYFRDHLFDYPDKKVAVPAGRCAVSHLRP